MATATMERTERERVTTAREREIALQPFSIVVDHPRNCDVLMQSIPNCRLRSAISASKPVIDVKTGEPRIPTDQAKHLGQIPPVPGMHLRVDPANLTYEITDPLYDDEDTCERLRQAINHSDINQRIQGKLRGAKPQGGTLDMHRMKTLCREVVWLLDAGDVKVVEGKRITLEDTDALPGNYLMNPGSRVQNGQPIFEKDFPRWYERLTAQGG